MGFIPPPPPRFVQLPTTPGRPPCPPSLQTRQRPEAYQCPYCGTLQPIKNLLCTNCGATVTIEANAQNHHP